MGVSCFKTTGISLNCPPQWWAGSASHSVMDIGKITAAYGHVLGNTISCDNQPGKGSLLPGMYSRIRSQNDITIITH